MTRLLNQQSYCSWCGASLTYKSEWMSVCSGCGYRDYRNPRPCSSVIIRRGSSVLLLKRAAKPAAGSYDLPGGFMDMEDTNMEACALRELQEETGISGNNVKSLDYFGSGLNPYDWQDSQIECACFFFIAELSSDTNKLNLNKKENTEYIWIEQEDLPNIDLAWDIDRQMLTKYFEERA